MRLSVDFDTPLGPVKPMHGVGQPPFASASDEAHFHYLTDAHIPFARLHDVGGPFGGYRFVDIPNIFRDPQADENDPASYDFVFTDWLIGRIIDAGCEPVFRLGVTIENQSKMRAYRIFPPADPAKWARICEKIVRHYNEGWADGYSWGIRYWEIWNEPDNSPDPLENQMWRGTPEQYYELYAVTARHLKACFGDTIRVGGYGSCGFYAAIGEACPAEAVCTPRFTYFLPFFENFLDYIRAKDAPLDFFSWHSYAQVRGTLEMEKYLTRTLASHGYAGTENHLNEWNTAPGRERAGSSHACATAAAMMLGFQHASTYMLCFYDARLGSSDYAGLFDPIHLAPVSTYHAFRAFGELYALGTEVACTTDESEVYAVAATDGRSGRAVMLSNISGKAQDVTTNLGGDMVVYLLDEAHPLVPADLDPRTFRLENDQVAYVCRK